MIYFITVTLIPRTPILTPFYLNCESYYQYFGSIFLFLFILLKEFGGNKWEKIDS